MRSIILPAALVIGAIQTASGEVGLSPEQLFREPYSDRLATFVEPANGTPLDFARGRFSLGNATLLPRLSGPRLTTEISSRTVRIVPVSGIMLRAAYGPTRVGMVTFRLRPDLGPVPVPEPFARIAPGDQGRPVDFVVALEDHGPGLMALSRTMKFVFTVERIEGSEGQLMFENPDATELLWQALGRPTLSRVFGTPELREPQNTQNTQKRFWILERNRPSSTPGR